MEVLISIGILSVGLASVIALIPAGGNEARRALISDRRGMLAANAAADAIARGVLNPAKWSIVPPGPLYPIAIDPLGGAAFPPFITQIALAGVVPGPDAESVFRGEDDISYKQPADDIAPALPVYVAGERATIGAFSWLATLLPAGAGSGPYRLSVVVFHGRQVPPAFPGPFFASGTVAASDIALNGLGGMSMDDFRETFERGSPVLLQSTGAVPVWRTITLPMPERGARGLVARAEILLDAPVPFATEQIFVYPGAVGIVEKTVRLEGQSPWAL